MKRSDIQTGETYRVHFFAQNVACRVISKQFFGFRLLVEYREHWAPGYAMYSVSSHKWSWKFLEGYDD